MSSLAIPIMNNLKLTNLPRLLYQTLPDAVARCLGQNKMPNYNGSMFSRANTYQPLGPEKMNILKLTKLDLRANVYQPIGNIPYFPLPLTSTKPLSQNYSPQQSSFMKSSLANINFMASNKLMISADILEKAPINMKPQSLTCSKTYFPQISCPSLRKTNYAKIDDSTTQVQGSCNSNQSQGQDIPALHNSYQVSCQTTHTNFMASLADIGHPPVFDSISQTGVMKPWNASFHDTPNPFLEEYSPLSPISNNTGTPTPPPIIKKKALELIKNTKSTETIWCRLFY